VAAEILGTPQAIVWNTDLDPAGQSVTVETGATAAYFMWATWPSGATGVGLASITLDGNAPDEILEIGEGAFDESATGVAVWFNPATGIKTLDLAWDDAPAEGPVSAFFCTVGGSTTASRDKDVAQGAAAAAVSVTLTTVSGDLVVKWDQRLSGTTPPANTAGWTSLLTQNNNSESARLASIVATGSTQVCPSEDENYSTIVAVAIEDAIFDGVLSGAAEADAAFVGEAAAQESGALSGAGEADASFTGRTTADAVLSAPGEADATFVGSSLAGAVLTAQGEADVVLVGVSLADGVLSAVGEADANLVGQGVAEGSALAAPGEAQAAFTGSSLAAAVLEALGDSSASFVGRADAAAVWAAAADSTGAFVGERVAQDTGSLSAAGEATGIFVGESIAASVLTAIAEATFTIVSDAPIFGWDTRGRIGSEQAHDHSERIGASTAKGRPGRIGGDKA
jgi:hypothetical protein